MSETLKAYYRRNNLLTISADSKTVKGEKLGYLTGILYLSPYKLSGKNYCSHATEGCIFGCLNTAGRGQMDFTQEARLKRSLFMNLHKEAFMLELYRRIQNMIKLAEKKNLIPCIRLNGTSDLRFENLKFNFNGKKRTLIQIFRTCQFYDYTKFPLETGRWDKLPNNYDLTFSLAETNSNRKEALKLLQVGKRIAAVYDHKKDLPEYQIFNYNGKSYKFPVIDADSSDLRFNDAGSVICGLKAKGKAKKDTSGFVLHNNIITIN